MKLLSQLKRSLLIPIGIAALATMGVAVLAAIEGLLYAQSVASYAWLVGVFALIGLFLGVIYATDPRSGFAVPDQPVVRAFASFAVGLSLAGLLGASAVVMVPCGAVFGFLGWLGMRWARYVDF